MYLEELIENVELESDKFECKSSSCRNFIHDFFKTLPLLCHSIIVYYECSKKLLHPSHQIHHKQLS